MNNKTENENNFYNWCMQTRAMKRAYDRKYKKKLRAKLRAEIIKILGEKCEFCGSTRFLEFHHDETNTLPSGGVKEREEGWILKHLEEMILLCKSCHARWHWVFRKLDRKAKKRATA